MSSAVPGRAEAIFEEMRAAGQKALDAGRLEAAAEILQTAVDLAIQQGDSRLIDVTRCNRAVALVELGRGEGEIPHLREILMRNDDLVSCRLAAYTIARHYEIAKSYKKALFYARISMDRSRLIGRHDWLASSHNLVADILLAESFVEEACSEYERALELISGDSVSARAQIRDNLGYCRILQRRTREGYGLLYASLRALRRLGARKHEISARLDLCFAHLETGRYRLARRQGMAALALAETIGDEAALKNALYLLGEVANLSGDVDAATLYFTRLHQDFFPDADYLPGFLLAVNVRTLVNLHA